MPLEPTWTSSVQIFACPAWFKIYFWDNVWVNPIPPAQADVLTFKPLNGFVDIETADYALDQLTWDIRLTKESIYSQVDQL